LHSGAPRSEPHLERTLAAIEAAERIRIHVVRDVDDSAWANVGCSLRVIQNRLRAFQAGENKYQITGGTGKMKGIKRSGTCKTTGTADGGLEYTCTGGYTLAGTAPAKQ